MLRRYASTTWAGGPAIRTLPCSIQRARLQISSTEFTSWVTRTISRAVAIISFMRSRALIWNAMSPALSTSSMSSTSGLTAVEMEKASRTSMPLE